MRSAPGSTQNQDCNSQSDHHEPASEQGSQSAGAEPPHDWSGWHERRLVAEERRSPDHLVETRRLRPHGVDVALVVRFRGPGHEPNVLVTRNGVVAFVASG